MVRKIIGILIIIIGLALIGLGIYGIFRGAIVGGIFIALGGFTLFSLGIACLKGEKAKDIIDDFTRYMPL